jgi:hypothetical protein
MLSDMSFTYGKHRTKDSYEDTSQGLEEIKSESLGFDNPEKMSSSSHYNLPWQRKLSTKYPAIKQKQDRYLSTGNQFEEHGFEDTLADNEEMESSSDDTIYDREGQDSFAYEDMPQDSEDEEESDDNRHMYDEEDGDDGGNGDIGNDYAPEIQETRMSDGSKTGLKDIYQQKDDGVQRVLNKVPRPSKTEDGTRSYNRGSSSRSSESGTEDYERTQNIIQSRIDHLKDIIKRQMATNFDSIQNARAPSYDNVPDGDVKWVQER